MKFIRAELHNHSTESDGALSVESLAAYAAEKNYGVLALTDHNTTSGHAKAYDAIRRAGYALALLPGVEITTFFGHILALGLVQMPDITTLDPRAPEPFFAMLRTAARVPWASHTRFPSAARCSSAAVLTGNARLERSGLYRGL